MELCYALFTACKFKLPLFPSVQPEMWLYAAISQLATALRNVLTDISAHVKSALRVTQFCCFPFIFCVVVDEHPGLPSQANSTRWRALLPRSKTWTTGPAGAPGPKLGAGGGRTIHHRPLTAIWRYAPIPLPFGGGDGGGGWGRGVKKSSLSCGEINEDRLSC